MYKCYHTGSDRELKRDEPHFNEKACHFAEQESLKAPRKRKANPKYKDSAGDENEEDKSINSQPSSKSKKKNTKQVTLSLLLGYKYHNVVCSGSCEFCTLQKN